MSETELIVSVIDQASANFDQIANSAETSFGTITSSADQASVGMDEASASTEEVGAALDSVDGSSLDQASSSADEAANSLDEASNSAESVGNATDNISDQAIQEAASSASSLGASFDEVTTKADEAANASDQVGNSTSNAASTGTSSMLLATAAIGGMTVGLEGAAEWSNQTNASFEKMGNANLPEAELRSMVAAMTNVHFPTEDALLYIKTLKQTGVTATESLNNGSIAFNTIAVGTGVASDRVVTFSNSMVAMGMDMNNIPAAYNAIAYANANMVGGFDTYINWMQKYDSTFKEMGLNIDQTAVLISAATEKFGGGRAAYTGLNEAIKASNGDLSVLEQQLGMQPGALANASEATAAYSGKLEKNTKISNEHTTILQQAKAYLTDLATQYGDVIGVVGSVGGVIGSATGIIMAASTAYTAHSTSIMANIAAKDAETGSTIANTAAENGGMLSRIASRASAMASAVATGVRTTALEIETGVTATAMGAAIAHTGATEANTTATNLSALSMIRGAISYGVHAVASGISTAAQWALNAAMDANPIMIVVLAIMALVAILFYLYNTNETVRGAIDWLLASLQALGSYIMGGLMAAWNGLMAALSPIINALGLLWVAVQKAFGAFAGGQAQQASGIFSAIAGAVMQLWNALSGLAGLILSVLMPYLQVLWQFLSGAFMAVWTTISGIVMGFINYIATLITILANLIASNITVGEALSQVWGAIQALLAQVFVSIILDIGQFAMDLINWGLQAAGGLLNAFVVYLSQLPGRAWSYFLEFLAYLAILPGIAASYAASVGSTILNTIGNYLSSLPGMMYQWGRNALQSFVDAIIDGIPGLRAALNAVSSLFPHSPPKEGPLATVKAENMERFGSTLTESMGEGLEEGAGDAFGFISKDNIKLTIDKLRDTDSSSKVSDVIKKLEILLVHDFQNVPQHIDTNMLKETLKDSQYDMDLIDVIIEMLTYGKARTKANLGA